MKRARSSSECDDAIERLSATTWFADRDGKVLEPAQADVDDPEGDEDSEEPPRVRLRKRS